MRQIKLISKLAKNSSCFSYFTPNPLIFALLSVHDKRRHKRYFSSVVMACICKEITNDPVRSFRLKDGCVWGLIRCRDCAQLRFYNSGKLFCLSGSKDRVVINQSQGWWFHPQLLLSTYQKWTEGAEPHVTTDGQVSTLATHHHTCATVCVNGWVKSKL